MKLRSIGVVAALLVASAFVLQAADVSGKWLAQVPGRDGQTREVTYTLKAEGETLSGTMATGQGEIEFKDGTVKGDEIAFTVVMNMQGNEVKLVHKGKVSGDEIAFTRQREGADRTQEFVAKRAK